jgi:uncharacterized protein (DUF924 family)
MDAEDLLGFWFGEAFASPVALETQMALWFGDPDDGPDDVARRDALLAARFGPAADAAARGGLDHWATTPRGRLALVLLLDQLPRNVHRGSARAFAADPAARGLTVEGLALGHDAALRPLERMFLYLPLEHSESLADQERCVALFEALEPEAPPGAEDAFRGFTRYARWHRDIVARFGRFPHRNRALGREDTAEEARYLAGDAPTFGQR